MRRLIIKKYYILGFLLLVGLSACNTAKYLKEDEYLLKKNTVKVVEESPIQNKNALAFELSQLYKQTPNTNFLILFPREWFYFATQDAKDTTRFDRWQRRVLAQEPALFSESLADSTARTMQYYLQYNGYYNANVIYDERTRGTSAKVTYFAYPKQQYTIDTVSFTSRDPTIDSILQITKSQSLLKSGAPLSGSLYEQERERIAQFMRNNGYAYFYSNYIAPLEADTSVQPYKANIRLEALLPAGDSSHRRYRVGSVTVYPQYDPTIEDEVLLDSTFGDYTLRVPSSILLVKAQTIINAIYLKPGELYSQENYDKTVRQFSAMSIYRFARVQETPDSVQPDVLNFTIELSRNAKFEIGADFEVNYTNRTGTSLTSLGNLIGITVSPTLRNRNLLRGAELFITNLSAGVEVNPDLSQPDSVFWNTIDLRAQAELYLPRFIDYFSIWRGLNKARLSKTSGLIKDRFYQQLEESAKTRISLSYNYLSLIRFYDYNLLNASFGYDLQSSTNTRYIINHIGINYLRPVIRPAFQTIIEANPFLKSSFGKQLFVSLLFRDFTFTHTTRPNRIGVSNYFGLNVELAGAEIWAGNALYNAFSLVSDTLSIGQGAEKTNFSQFVKLEGDFRVYRNFTPRASLAARLNVGFARPFGYTTDVPYVKQFYVGGPNSIRGWAIRELGPGGYIDPLVSDEANRNRNRLLYYQTGDLKLEFNVEYRFPIFSLLNGAIFLDGGNIWTVERDSSRAGSQFLFAPRPVENPTVRYKVNDAFYKQIALNTGFGIRLDLSYFVIRLDAGVKLRSPYPLNPQGEKVTARDYWYNFEKWGIRDINFNLGLGYPF